MMTLGKLHAAFLVDVLMLTLPPLLSKRQVNTIDKKVLVNFCRILRRKPENDHKNDLHGAYQAPDPRTVAAIRKSGVILKRGSFLQLRIRNCCFLREFDKP